MNRSLAFVLALCGCDQVYNLTRPPADAAPPDGVADSVDAPPGICDWATRSAETSIPQKGTAIAAGDFDGDEHLDLAIGTDGEARLHWFLNDNGGFPLGRVVDSTHPIRALATGRIDSDDLDDVAVAGASGSNYSAAAMLSTGSSWDRRAVSLLGGAPSSIALANLNVMGLLDMVVTIPDGQFAQVLMGDDTMYVRGQSVPTLEGPVSVAIANYDGDQDVDLVIALSQDNSVALHPDNGSNFVAGPVLSAGTTPSAVAIARLGTRQVLDIAVANKMSNNVIIVRNDGSGVFAPSEILQVGMEPVALAIADIDGDGRADILTANHKSNSISLVRGTDTGFELARMYMTVDKPNALAIGDFNDDQRLDIAVLGDAGFVVHPATCQ